MIIQRPNVDGYRYGRIPSLALTSKKTLIACYEWRRELSDWSKIDLKFIRSTDGGETWENVKIIYGDTHTLNNPVFIIKGETVHFLFCEDYKRMFHCKSTDDGKTFTEPSEITYAIENAFPYTVVAPGPGHGTVHNGNLIAPIWVVNNPSDLLAHRPSFISTIYSDDDGESWSVGEVIGKYLFTNPSEAAIAVDNDNRVCLSIRNENREKARRGFAVSDNGYSNWSKVQFAEALPDPICQGSMYSFNGKLYHINCNHTTERKNLTVKISGDCFETYNEIVIDDNSGYSDIAVDENYIYVFYERDIMNEGLLIFKKIEK